MDVSKRAGRAQEGTENRMTAVDRDQRDRSLRRLDHLRIDDRLRADGVGERREVHVRSEREQHAAAAAQIGGNLVAAVAIERAGAEHNRARPAVGRTADGRERRKRGAVQHRDRERAAIVRDTDNARSTYRPAFDEPGGSAVMTTTGTAPGGSSTRYRALSA